MASKTQSPFRLQLSSVAQAHVSVVVEAQTTKEGRIQATWCRTNWQQPIPCEQTLVGLEFSVVVG